MSFPRYEKYKDSGVEWLGEVPEGWEVVRLKQVCQVFPSNVDKKSYEDQPPIKLCNYTDVYYNEAITSELEFMAATATIEQIQKFSLKAGDTIITKDSETADDIAIAAYVPEDLPGIICGYHLSMIRPKADVCGSFIKRLFDSWYAKSKFAVLANGLTRVGLGQYALDNIELPFPPLPDQRAIAAFLDHETGKIDALVAEQEKLIGLLKEKRQAVISHAVTKGLDPNARMKDSGVEWLGEVPEGWKVVMIRRCLIEHRQGYYSSNPYSESGVKLLRITDLRDHGSVSFDDCPFVEHEEGISPFLLQQGDFVFARTGGAGSFGVIGEIKELVAYASYLIRFRFDTSSVTTEFLRFFFHSDCFQKAIKQNIHGGVNQNVHAEDIKDQYIAIPSESEQLNIASFLITETAKFDTLIEEAQKAIELMKERRTALISAAVTGKIDVRGRV